MRLYSFNKTKATIAALLCVAFVAMVASGCKGRTRESMEPTGDTVTVDVKSQNQETVLDSLADYAPPVNPM